MSIEKYDLIGKTYNKTRQADKRIVDIIVDKLQLSSEDTILDIGAGTGNYTAELSKKGFNLIAVEPSEVMRAQGRKDLNIKWLSGVSESLPLEDSSVNGVICVLAVHHFSDLEKSFNEMVRVLKSKGSIVILAADPRLCLKDCWLTDYFTEIMKRGYEAYQPINDVKVLLEKATDNGVELVDFLIPEDIADRFFFSGWKYPEMYLDPLFCAGVSPLANAPKEYLDSCLERLRNDLDSGLWQEKYGHILKLSEYEGGYRFLIGRKK
ncbi:MAG: class I SAM-dependent methyltransferase [Bacillota bacterium]|nr:class I SAM-dependent methyltransferase [Bacillota bacterium]